MGKREHIVADAVIGDRGIVIPLRTAVLNTVQYIQRFCVMSAVQIVCGCLQADRIFILPLRLPRVLPVVAGSSENVIPEISETAVTSCISVSVTSGAAAAAVTAACPRRGIRMLPFVHNLLVSGLYLFEFFLGLRLVRIVNIGVRMIFARKLPVCLFHFLVTGVSVDAKDLIRITH